MSDDPYPYADAAVLTTGHEHQTCAVCGDLIILVPLGDPMTFDTRAAENVKGYDILTMHLACDPRGRKR